MEKDREESSLASNATFENSVSVQKQELQELDRISILFQLGFRPFFLGAGMIAVLFMILWTASYSFGWAHSFPRMSSIHLNEEWVIRWN